MPYDPTGAVIRNLFALQGVGNAIASDVDDLLRQLFDDIAAEISRADPNPGDGSVWRRQEIDALVSKIEAKTGDAFDGIYAAVRKAVAEVGGQQSSWAVDLLDSAAEGAGVDVSRGDVTINYAKSWIDNNPLQGELLSDWFDGLGDNVVKSVRRQIQLGLADNETTDDIVRRIRGTSNGRGGFVGGVMDTTSNAAEAIVRTAVNDIANAAHQATWSANSDIAPKWRFVATLDSRTCPICGDYDGQVFDVDDDSAPVPPLHVNDRCVSVPVIDWDALGVDAPKDGTRAATGGPVSSTETYEDWLSDQDAAVQDDILGPARAQLFRDGKVGLSDLVTGDGRIVRVADL